MVAAEQKICYTESRTAVPMAFCGAGQRLCRGDPAVWKEPVRKENRHAAHEKPTALHCFSHFPGGIIVPNSGGTAVYAAMPLFLGRSL